MATATGSIVDTALGEIPVVGGIASTIAKAVGGDPNKDQERVQAIQSLEQQAAAGSASALSQLQEWATGQSVGGDSSRADEPEASRLIASQALSSLGDSVPAQFNGQTITASSLNPSQQMELSTMGGGSIPGVSNGSSGIGGVASTIAGVGGAIQANSEQNQANNLNNQALQEAQQAYNSTAGLRQQGIAGVQSAMAGAPDLSSTFAEPSNPWGHSAATIPGTQVNPTAANEANTAIPGAVPQNVIAPVSSTTTPQTTIPAVGAK